MEGKQTKCFKGRDGWQALTIFPLDHLGNEIVIITSRSSRKLVTTALRQKRVGRFVQFTVYGDCHKRWGTKECRRASEQAVRAEHEKVLAQIDEIKADVKAYYEKKQAQVV